MKYVLAVVLLTFTVSVPHQQNVQQGAKNTQSRESRGAIKVNLWSPGWESGEVKMCSTYDNSPSLLLCDDKALMELLGDAVESGMRSGAFKTMTKEEQEEYEYETAFRYATSHAKMFYVRFSRTPWPKEPTKELKLALWDCTKEKEISC